MPDFLDKAKDLAQQHDDQVEGALDKVADLVGSRTGHKHDDKIDKAVDKIEDLLGIGDDDAKKASGGAGAKPEAKPKATTKKVYGKPRRS
jgi:hypothetical protein